MTHESLSTDAVVLRSVPYGDADLVLTLFTRARGRLSALARSARRSRKRFAGCLQLFTVSSVQLTTRGGDLWTLSSAELVESFVELATDMGSFAHASYGTELVRELTAAEQPDEALLELVIELYRVLCAGPSPQVLRAYELRLLDLLGLSPVIDRCVGCGTGDVDGRGVILDASRGGVCCERCAALSRSVGVRPLSGAARRVLSAAQRAPSLVAARAATEEAPGDAAEARDALLSLILGHVGKPLRSLEFIAKVSGASRQRRAES